MQTWYAKFQPLIPLHHYVHGVMETCVRRERHWWDENQTLNQPANFEVCGSLNADIIIVSTTQIFDWFGVGSVLIRLQLSMTKVFVVVTPKCWKARQWFFAQKKGKGSREHQQSRMMCQMHRYSKTVAPIQGTTSIGPTVVICTEKSCTKHQDLQIPKERRDFGNQKCGVPVSVDCGCHGPVFRQVDTNHLAAKVQILASWFRVAKAWFGLLWCGSVGEKGGGIMWHLGSGLQVECLVYAVWSRQVWVGWS